MRHLNPLDGAGYFFPLHGLIIHVPFTYATKKYPHEIGYSWIGVCYYCHWNKRGEVCRVLFNFLKVVEV